MPTVTVDDRAIHYQPPHGDPVVIEWQDLLSVSILTTSAGPFVDDIFWVLETAADRCIIPGESAGLQELVDRLFKLPGFDHNAAIAAMSSADDKVFHCWKKI